MKRNSLKLICSALLVMMVGATVIGCGSNDSKQSSDKVIISVSGSTSVGPFMEKAAEKYEKEHSNVSIEINQTGSGPGIKDTMDGVNEIGMSSRNLKSEEANVIKATPIAYDGIAVTTNKNNPIKNITVEQLKGIYTGKITNWKQIEGGKDAPIVVVSREEGSGTRDAFQTLIGYKSEELLKDAMISNGNGAVKESVIGNENAIGFLSFDYLDDSINISKVEGVEATSTNVKSKTYKLSRPFLVLTKEDKITQEGQKFIDYILSDEGQKLVSDNKLITLK